MRLSLIALLLAVSQIGFAIFEVGDTVPNRCWKDTANQDTCLDSMAGNVRVLIHNTGWCPDCHNFFSELIPRLSEIHSTQVKFLSLSAAGWTKGSLPDATFLSEWKTNYQIPFPVLASPKDAGKDFFEQPYIPNAVLLDRDGKITFKSNEPNIDELFQKIRELVQH